MSLNRVNEILAETLYMIGDSGLEPLQTSDILIQPNVKYHMGASGSPSTIFVTKVDDKMIYYKDYPFYGARENRIDKRIGIDLILRGINTFLKGGYVNYPWGKQEAKKYKTLMAGKKVKPERLKDYQQIVVTVDPAKGYEGKDLWSEAERYGGVGQTKLDDRWVYTIHTTLKVLPKIRKDKMFKVLKVEEDK